jgi:transposase
LGAAASQLGPEAQALALTLRKESGLSDGKIQRVYELAFGIQLARATPCRQLLRAAVRCTPQYQEIAIHVRTSPVAYADETGWKVGGRLQWLWAFVTNWATLYLVRPGRGRDILCQGLGAGYAGLLGHDGWRPYEELTRATHQTCLRHLLDHCEDRLACAYGASRRFSQAALGLLKESLLLRDARLAQPDIALSEEWMCAVPVLEERWARLLKNAKSDRGNERLRRHLERNRAWTFTFLHHPQIEATNWPAEQAMRPAVVNRKVWGGSRTEAGARAHERLISVLRTCRQQGLNALDFLARLLRAPPSSPPPRLILHPG